MEEPVIIESNSEVPTESVQCDKCDGFLVEKQHLTEQLGVSQAALNETKKNLEASGLSL